MLVSCPAGLVSCWYGVMLVWCHDGLVSCWYGVMLVSCHAGMVSCWYGAMLVSCHAGMVWSRLSPNRPAAKFSVRNETYGKFFKVFADFGGFL